MMYKNTFLNKKRIFCLGVILFLYSVLYLPLLSEHIFGGDSAEFATTLATWSISHPPGYPLYTFLGNVFTHIVPIQNIYTSESLYTSIFSLFSVILIFVIIYKLIHSYWISLVSSVVFMFLFPIWLYSLVPEVFSLASLLILSQILILITLNDKGKPKKRWLALFFLSLGLSVSHHHIFLFFLPSYVYFIYNRKAIFDKITKNIELSIFSFFIGCSLYIYAPIASLFNPPMDVENAKTLDGFVRLITRSSYGSFKAFSSSGGNFFNRFFDLFSSFVFIMHDLKPLGLILIVGGFFYLKKTNLFMFRFLLINLLSVFFFLFYTNFSLINSFGVATYERFLIFLYTVLIFYFAYGLKLLHIMLEKVKTLIHHSLLLRFTDFVYIGLCTILIVSIIKGSYNSLSLIKNLTEFEKFGQDILDSTQQNSLLLLTGDNNIFITSNYLYLKKIRQDVALFKPYTFSKRNLKDSFIKKFPHIIVPNINYADEKEITLDFYSQNYKNGIPILADSPSKEGVWAPYGLLWKFYPSTTEFEKDRKLIIETNKQLWSKFKPPIVTKENGNLLFLGDIQTYYAKQFWSYINLLMVNGQKDKALQLANQYFTVYKHDYRFLLLYVALKTSLNSCTELDPIVTSMLEKNQIQQSDDYKIIVAFYNTCHNDSKLMQEIIKRYEDLKKNEERSLDTL